MSLPDQIVNLILKYEGSTYSNDPRDPGGATKYGWTLKSYKNIFPTATVDDIKNLTQDEAMDLYDKYWWQKYGANKITSIKTANTLLLAQINMGPSKPNKLLQQLCNEFGDYNLIIDGLLGEQSIHAINNCPYIENSFPGILFHDLYMPLINHGMEHYKKGWRNRVMNYENSI